MKRIPKGILFFLSLMLFLLTVQLTYPEWTGFFSALPNPETIEGLLETVLMDLHLFG